VSEILGERFPRTMELALLTLVLALVWAVPVEVVSAVRQDTVIDYVARLVSVSGLSIPLLFTGVLILFLLMRVFQWMPPREYTPFFEDPIENLKPLIWPALAQAYYISARSRA